MLKKSLVFILLILMVIYTNAQQKDLLSGKYKLEELRQILIPLDQWTPFPKITDREGWKKADQEMLAGFIKEAEKYKDYNWPIIPATKSLAIVRTGNRSEYENISFTRRKVLGVLLLAEIAENKGRFMDQIINGVWAICEESFWGASAHLPMNKTYAGLPDVSQPFVELFSAETATYLAYTDYFLGDKLDAISPQIRKRIREEVNTRIFKPLMTDHYPWMSADPKTGRRPNNWNPWICSNWLNAALILEKDENKRTAMVNKALQILDAYLNPYPEDGGCDEGPSYWGAAPASLDDCLSVLNLASNHAFDYVFKDEKIRNMGKFIYRMQIDKTRFVNFADAPPAMVVDGKMVYRYGKAIGDQDMMAFGASYQNTSKFGELQFHYFRKFFDLFEQQEFKQAQQKFPLPVDVWLPDLEVMAARDREGSSDGFFVAAKGGNNDESHNHNDVGNFVVYYNGEPLIIDVGSGTYTAKTFSSKRYDIWSNQSDYHNVPNINGFAQAPGPAYKAQQVKYNKNKSSANFTMDLSAAYPKAAGINSWQRTVRLERHKSVGVKDVMNLQHAEKIVQHLMTCYPVSIGKPGELVIHYEANKQAKDFIIHYNSDQMSAEVEKVKLDAPEDRGVMNSWGDRIYRISWKVKQPKMQDKIEFGISLK